MSDNQKYTIKGSIIRDNDFDFTIEKRNLEPTISKDDNQLRLYELYIIILTNRLNMYTDSIPLGQLTGRLREIWDIVKDDNTPLCIVYDKRTSWYFKPSLVFKKL